MVSHLHTYLDTCSRTRLHTTLRMDQDDCQWLQQEPARHICSTLSPFHHTLYAIVLHNASHCCHHRGTHEDVVDQLLATITCIVELMISARNGGIQTGKHAYTSDHMQWQLIEYEHTRTRTYTHTHTHVHTHTYTHTHTHNHTLTHISALQAILTISESVHHVASTQCAGQRATKALTGKPGWKREGEVWQCVV